ncbi:cohesin domain-containing protein [Natronorubrum daqingense]|uniref:Cohesin domain-containing protein n=1 Tax=Natronorubrum daqingense TaxID=588898 RepID=A0A1N6XDL2_9EURY|nr:cohesin domain-containing protein [Natronorubrum daqingense]APX95979.1 hypothetical protein BB347_04735 [Natronorubrum daqingense]SIR00403.1 Cohesin domain-containing protein [Natronorubrum daqingense]
MSTSPPRRRRSAVIAAALACALVAGLVVPATVAGGDNATTIYFDPHESEANAGETITVDLVASTHGDYVGDGIDELSVDLEYDSDLLTVTDVEHGLMLAEGSNDAEVNGATDFDEDGAVSIEQEREPSGDGAVATETAATITVEVAEDAPSTETDLEITDSEAMLISEYPQASIERDGSIEIDGDSSDGADDSIPAGTPLVALVAVGGTLLFLCRRR